jgi:Flp pilus assembly protein TadD
MADRYSYLPSIGLLVILMWSVPEWCIASVGRRVVFGFLAGLVLVVLIRATWVQIGYWRDSVSLFDHSVAVTSNNDFAEYSIGCAYWVERQNASQAIEHFEKALSLRPDMASAHDNLGIILGAIGRPDAAIVHFRRAAEIDPASFEVRNNWGCLLADRGDFDGAIEQFRTALATNPSYFDAHVNLGITLLRSKRQAEAIECLEYASRLVPGNPVVERALAEARSASR